MVNAWLRIGAITGALGVILGAFGAHGLKNSIKDEKMLKNWDTAAHYHLIHAVALTLTGFLPTTNNSLPKSGYCFMIGIAVFSGSLYAMVLSGKRWLGAITPIGGLAMIAGWLLLALY
eukprot:TRINITY_DN2529_c0_g1_i1.p1 TRINITY_DN2529_c0_g1~~TRINITY_DN2529_c0_g1_i1.p1  ORF type:complete len:118 (-),score=28.79 TRINITY_DN2529_c0_g1_i1:21-374(-)